MLKIYLFSSFYKKILLRRFLFLAMIFSTMTYILVGCTENTWENHGDSCILTSENPPLKRVINYTDHDLCGRELSPRFAPNPKTRINTEKD